VVVLISVVYYSEWRTDGCEVGGREGGGRGGRGSGEVAFEVVGGGARSRAREGKMQRVGSSGG